MTLSEDFAQALNVKFEKDEFHSNMEVHKGRRFDKIVRVNKYGDRSVFAFVERATGDLYKAAGWKAPAKHKRYNGNELLSMAVEDADMYGSFLYMR